MRPLQSAFSLTSPFGPGEAAVRLTDAIAAPSSPTRRDGRRPFVGRFDGLSFDMMRTTRARNSFRPRIRGTIEPSSGGTRIHGTMQIHEAVLVFLAIFFLAPMWLFVQMAANAFRTGQWDPFMFVIPGVVIGLTVIILLAYTLERRRALKELTLLLDAESSITRS